MRKQLSLVSWLIFVALLSAALGMRSAKATCNSGSYNYGPRYSAICTCPTVDCGGDCCETDRCNYGGPNCAPGYRTYCVSNTYCGNPQTSGCYGIPCGASSATFPQVRGR